MIMVPSLLEPTEQTVVSLVDSWKDPFPSDLPGPSLALLAFSTSNPMVLVLASTLFWPPVSSKALSLVSSFRRL